jgi:GNAT superfamily N-acetyltransferase
LKESWVPAFAGMTIELYGIGSILGKMKSIVVQPLAPSHIADAARIYHDVWHETQAGLQDVGIAMTRDLDFFTRRVELAVNSSLLAISENIGIGYVAWQGDELDHLFISKGHRGQGIGQQLLAQALHHMAEAGQTSAWLNCVVGNHAARRFYEREGWHFDKTEIIQAQHIDGFADVSIWKMARDIKPH